MHWSKCSNSKTEECFWRAWRRESFAKKKSLGLTDNFYGELKKMNILVSSFYQNRFNTLLTTFQSFFLNGCCYCHLLLTNKFHQVIYSQCWEENFSLMLHIISFKRPYHCPSKMRAVKCIHTLSRWGTRLLCWRGFMHVELPYNNKCKKIETKIINF